MSIVGVSRSALAVGSIAIGVWGVVAPRHLATIMGDDPALARLLAVRDGLIGLSLLSSDRIVPLLVRTAADVTDAVRLRHRSPFVAGGALAFGLCSLLTALASLEQTTHGQTSR